MMTMEVEEIGKIRHKHLVGLIGYSVEGAQRLLVYEFIDNGNLEQWLHGELGPVSPLTLEIMMKIASGRRRGLAYLHEGLEPKFVHRDVKSSNILLDKKWNPKVSDFGLAKLLESDKTHVTTRVMGTFGERCVQLWSFTHGNINLKEPCGTIPDRLERSKPLQIWDKIFGAAIDQTTSWKRKKYDFSK